MLVEPTLDLVTVELPTATTEEEEDTGDPCLTSHSRTREATIRVIVVQTTPMSVAWTLSHA